MAQRFQNGLKLIHATTDQTCRTINRYLVEFLVNVVGWTKFDVVTGTRWDNYVASGLTASTAANNIIAITSPSYAFTSADADGYLTLTGFSNAARNGIYQIRNLVSVVGNVFTLQLEKYTGPHELGMPVGDSGITWKFWKGHDTYTPLAGDVIVLQGTGYTGAGLNNGQGTGDSIAMAGSTATLTDSSANFQLTDVGKSITVAGAGISGNNGTFPIVSQISPTQITYTNASGADETSSFTWQISYGYHLHLKVATAAQYQPLFRISPFASWNSGTHAWNDNKYTSELGFHGVSSLDNSNYHFLQVEADLDHFSISMSSVRVGLYSFNTFLHIGEIDTFNPSIDVRPVLGSRSVVVGNSNDWNTFIIGTGKTGLLTETHYGLSWDDLTTLSYRLMYHHTAVSGDSNYLTGINRSRSRYSNKLYRLPIIVESQTSGHMELRGKLRNVWVTGNSNAASTPFGENLEYLMAYAGIVIPWNGSRCPHPELPATRLYGA